MGQERLFGYRTPETVHRISVNGMCGLQMTEKNEMQPCKNSVSSNYVMQYTLKAILQWHLEFIVLMVPPTLSALLWY